MVLAKNEAFSLHKLRPHTYSHSTYVLVEKDKRWTHNEHHVTMLQGVKDENVSKIVESIKSGATTYETLYPLHFLCNGHQKIGACVQPEKTIVINELS